MQTLEQWTGGNTSPDVTYVWGPGQAPIAQSRTGGSVSHFITDGLGSVRGLTSSSQGVTDTLDYEAYGKVVSRTGTTPLVYEFAGQHIDQHTGYSYNRRRSGDGIRIAQIPFLMTLNLPSLRESSRGCLR